MPNEVIARVHYIAERQKCPSGLVFTRQDGTTYDDDDDNSVQEDVDNADPEDPEDGYDQDAIEDAENTGVPEVMENAGVNPDNDMLLDEVFEDAVENIQVDNEAPEENINLQDQGPAVREPIIAEDEWENAVEVAGGNVPNENVEAAVERGYQTRSGRRVKRPTLQSAEEGHQFTAIMANDGDTIKTKYSLATDVIAAKETKVMDEFLCAQTTYINSLHTFAEVNQATECAINHLIMTQVGMKKGVRLWGEQGIEAVIAEMKQFHDRGVVRPLPAKEITREMKKRALGYLMFLKKKRNGEIKGRGCADGRPQRVYKSKEETCSPTACTESIFITALTDAQEGRDVAVVDIPGAFLQTMASDGTIIKLQGAIVGIMLKVNPSWKEFVVLEGKRKVPTIYSEAIKALYGTVDAAKLFYDNLCSILVDELGFKLNPYDACVANKDINGKQCTIVWHVDDLKISHKDAKVVTSIIEELEKRFGKTMPLSISRGKVHEYLGMIFDFTAKGEVHISMYQYITGVINNAPEIYKQGTGGTTPAPSNLYEVRDPESDLVEFLDEKEKDEYHSLTAQLLYLSKRGRPDIQQATAFHCTRVIRPDRDDQKKLAKTLKYLIATIHIPLILSMGTSGISEWWIDASFAIHDDMRSRTGSIMSLGKGALYSASTKQKIMTSSSTEAELVGVSDTLPKILWCRHFMEAQGCVVEDVYVYQDNQSAILLENNGIKSVGKGTRHIKIKYFFVTDKIKDNELRIMWCPTEKMVGDFYTKPLQGSLFVEHRNAIQGIKQEDMPVYIRNYKQFMDSIDIV